MALIVNYIAWTITVLGAINSNLTFIFDLNYILWKLETSKRQGVSFLLETKHKFLKPIPPMPVKDATSSLKICSTFSRIDDQQVVTSAPPPSQKRNMGVFVVTFLWGLRGLRGSLFSRHQGPGCSKPH